MAEKKKKCFIIMPITTPDNYVSIYNDKDHFKHVLDCLFIPAIEKANMQPIKPVARGAELIQARIIKNLEVSDVVLCDMSILNPNVFFEFGVRTALNKPICIVKDDNTERIPFDITIINHHTYKSSIPAWDLDDEIKDLSAHLEKSFKTSPDSNELWKYLSFTQTAQAPKEGEVDRIEMLVHQVQTLKTIILDSRRKDTFYEPSIREERQFRRAMEVFVEVAEDNSFTVKEKYIKAQIADFIIDVTNMDAREVANFMNKIRRTSSYPYSIGESETELSFSFHNERHPAR